MNSDQPATPHRVTNTLSGRAGSVVQAGAIHGDVHVHDSGGLPTIPRQLLPAADFLVGRDREMAWLDQAGRRRRDRPAILILKGSGGVGKTALANQWLRREQHRFPDGQLYTKLTDTRGAPVAPEDVLGEFLRALGIDPRRVPAGLSERAALFRSVTARLTLAVLLDDAISAAQVRVLVPASPGSAVVVTSRRTLFGLLTDGALVLDVRPLDHSSAADLLTRRLGADRMAAEPSHATELAVLCDGLPIALNVVAALVLARPNRLLARTVTELRDRRRRLERLSVDSDTSVSVTFDASYRRLSAAGAAAYRVMGLHPGAAFSLRQIAAATAADVVDAEAAMEELVDANMLDEIGDGYYRPHDLIKVHAHDHAVRHDAERGAAPVRLLIEWYLAAARAADRQVLPARTLLPYTPDAASDRFELPDLTDYPTALRWLEDERSNLVAAVRAASERGWHALTYVLADAMQPVIIIHRHYRVAVEVDTVALRSVLADDNHGVEVDVRQRLARFSTRLGDLVTAQRHVDLLLAMTRSRGDRRGEASALKSQAAVHARAGKLPQAVAAYQATLDILTELDRPRAIGLAATDLGDVLVALGRCDDAVPLLERARTLLSGLPEPDEYNAARTTITLARAHIGVGDHATAGDLLHATLVAMREHDSTFQQARVHRALADLARAVGDEAAATEHDATANRLDNTPLS